MKGFKKIILASGVTVVMVAVALVTVGRTTANAQGLEQQNDDQQQSSSSAVYTYTAQPGDSYSLMARKAIQTYGLTNKVDLNEAQIIFAETNLTQAAGSPVLVQGQKVEIKEETVKEWAEKAKDLNQEKQSAWNVYAQHANFNTNNVGQSS